MHETMIRRNDKIYTSPVDRTPGLTGGTWEMLLLFLLHCLDGNNRAALKAHLPGVSEEMLSPQLEEMERNKLTAKDRRSERPYRAGYYLTRRGRSPGRSIRLSVRAVSGHFPENDTGCIKGPALHKMRRLLDLIPSPSIEPPFLKLMP